MLLKSLQETFSRDHYIIGQPKVISHKTFALYLNKPLYIFITLRPGFAPETCKDITGYVGLINEGTTCYMNSLLQTLFLITAFREIVYSLPPSQNDRIPQALKRLFKELEKSNFPPSTQGLLRSFGWGRDQWRVQHDVQEFNYTLSAALEQTVNDHASQGAYSKIFKGKTLQQIHCMNVNYTSKVYEEFIDLQLDIKWHGTIYESLTTYFSQLDLTGELQYDADGFGLQDAQKIIRFAELPPVLQIQLKRFDFNAYSGSMEKLNDRFEFYDEIDLDPYVCEEIRGDNRYRLFSILVHSGTPASGHYYSFISPKLDNNWFRFNDESVDKAIPSQAINANWGGEMKDLILSETGEVSIGNTVSNTSAYMLIYIKTSEIDLVLPNLERNSANAIEIINVEEEIPFDPEIQIIEYCKVALVSKEMLLGSSDFGMYASYDPSGYFIHEIRSNATIQDLINFLFPHLKINRFWHFRPGTVN